MELNIGDKIKYEDVYGDSFKGLIIDIWTNDDEEITGYFTVTNSGLYVHFKPDSLEWVCLEESVPVP
ncbi:MAG: hypothetical protein JSU79_11355 [Dehalococcoidales bacterium]|nr:MAG: hypothetical protein JSU79_11355 [Dehalococcoidales bacterium]